MNEMDKAEYARELRDRMRKELRGRLNYEEERTLCNLLALGLCQGDRYNFNHLPIHEGDASDELIRKLELLSGPNAYAMLKALMAREVMM